MNKQVFMSILKQNLKGIPESDLRDLLFDYEEHFAFGLKEGRNEEEIAASLGNPRSIAKEIRADYLITKVEETPNVANFLRALLATVGLGFFNLVFILGPFIGIAATFFSLLVVGFALIFSGIAIFISIFLQPMFPEYINNPVNPIVTTFISIGLTAFGLLWSIASFYVNKWFYVITVKYLKFNLTIITNRRVK